MQISVMLSNFSQPFEEALETVLKLEIPAVQLSAGPDDDAAKVRAMADAVAARGLKVSALCVDLGDLGESEKGDELIEKARPLIDMAAQSGSGICQTHIGIMPHTMTGARWDSYLRCGEILARYGESAGACLALETGPEPAKVMESFMRAIDSPAMKVNYDPANLIIWPAALPKFADLAEHTGREIGVYDREAAIAEFEPVEGVKRLAPFIVHTHAKDGIGNGGWGDVPLGEGWVDWPRYLRLLKEGGYDGYLTIEREAGNDPIGEIGHAARFLREQLKQLESV